MAALGFTLAGSGHAIIPVMVGDAALATEFAARMLDRGVYVVGFSYPVVPMGQARIRTQMSAGPHRGRPGESRRRVRRRRPRARGDRVKALVKARAAAGLELRDVDVPRIGPNDVLIRIRHASLCGTDLHIWNWDEWAQRTIPVPMTIGHEFGGEIAAVGDEVVGLHVGQRVSGEGHITCGHCRNCRAGRRHLCRNTVGIGVNRDGAFAEYLSLPAVNVFPLPDAVSDDIASILDPLGNAVHTALSFDLVGEDVLITGCGPIGVMAAAIARSSGRVTSWRPTSTSTAWSWLAAWA